MISLLPLSSLGTTTIHLLLFCLNLDSRPAGRTDGQEEEEGTGNQYEVEADHRHHHRIAPGGFWGQAGSSNSFVLFLISFDIFAKYRVLSCRHQCFGQLFRRPLNYLTGIRCWMDAGHVCERGEYGGLGRPGWPKEERFKEPSRNFSPSISMSFCILLMLG